MTAEVLATYEAWHMASFAAATRNRFGAGSGYFVGTVVEQDRFYDLLVADILDNAGVAAPVVPPDGVEVSVREGNGKRLLFLINHAAEDRSVAVPAGKMELLTDAETTGSLVLERYGVAVIQLD